MNAEDLFRTVEKFHPISRYLFASAVVALFGLVRFAILPLDYGLPFTLFVPAVIISFALAGIGPGILSVILSALTAVYMFLRPHYSFMLSPDGAIALTAFLFTCVVTGFFAHLSQAYRSKNNAALNEIKRANQRKDEFLITLGHELRTPLATIQLAIDVIERDASDPMKVRALARNAKRQVSHLSRLAAETLQVSRINLDKIEMQKSRVDLNRLLVEETSCRTASFSERDIELKLALPKETLCVFGDELRLTQIIGNILDNAVKYTEERGVVEVSLSRNDNQALIKVRDSGIGIPPDKIEWVFELFHQIRSGRDRTGEGVGIGLALAHKLVQLHGGSIEAFSEGLGKGAEFDVRLPLAHEPPVTFS